MNRLTTTFRELFALTVLVCLASAVFDVTQSMTLGWRFYPVVDIGAVSLFSIWLTLAIAPVIAVCVVILVLIIGAGSDETVQNFRRRSWTTTSPNKKHTLSVVAAYLFLWGLGGLLVTYLAQEVPNYLHAHAAVPLISAIIVLVIARFKLSIHFAVAVLLILGSTWYLYVNEIQAYFPNFAVLTSPAMLVGSTLVVATRRIELPNIANKIAAGLCLASLCAGFWFPTHSRFSTTLFSESGLAVGSAKSLRLISDVDFDGYSNWFDSRDCAPYDPERHIRSLEEPGNGVDENCVGGDGTIPKFVSKNEQLTLTKPPKNLLLITIDTLQARVVGMKKNGVEITPNLNKFAKRSWDFKHAFAPSTHTQESVPSLMSGTYPSDWYQSGLYFGAESTLAETFKKLQYQTFATIALPSLGGAMLDGFDYVDNNLGTDSDKTSTSDATTVKALEAITNRQKNRPFMAWVHYFDPHASYNAIPQYKEALGESDSDYYLHDVVRADHGFGTLIDALSESGVLDHTVVIITSDHGEGLGLNNIQTHFWKATTAVTHVPLFIAGPGIEPREIHDSVSLVDIYPTVIELFGIIGDQPRDGHSLVDRDPSLPFFIEATTDVPLMRGVVKGQHKLVYDWQHDTYMLTNVVTDQDELHNLIDEKPEIFAELKQLLWEWWDQQYGLATMFHRAERGKLGARVREMPPYEGPPVHMAE